MRALRTWAPGIFGLGWPGVKSAMVLVAIVLACSACASALDSSLDISQYAHTAWRVRDGFAKGDIYQIAQTPDGYLWLGTEFGLLRFDGVRAIPWQPPGGQQLPSDYISGLLVARDGTLWIGTFNGLASWKNGRFIRYREVAGFPVGSLFEDRDQTVWFGVHEQSKGRLCTIRNTRIECYGAGMFGNIVMAPYQDHKGNLWVSSSTGLWRWSPGPPERYTFPPGVTEANGVTEDDDGALLLATNDGVKRFAAGKIENYPLPGISGHFRPNRFFRSSDGSLWIGTHQGLLHRHQGRIDGFNSIDGLTGDFVGTIFQDRESTIWIGTTDGLDRFREYAIPTISRNQGLSGTYSVQATPDGSIWMGTADGLNCWENGHLTIYRGRTALGHGRRGDEPESTQAPTEAANSGFSGTPESLGVDPSGRLWVSTGDGVFYFERSRFVRVPGIPAGTIYSIAGDGHGKVWILHAHEGLFYWSPTVAIQQVRWPEFGQKAPRVMLPDREPGGVWLGFFEGGLDYLKDGNLARSFGAADGLGEGRVNQLRFGSLGAVLAATEGGLSRIKDGHIETLNSKNGLPCDEVHWSAEDDDHAVWVYMPCGLARIESSEWHAWVDNPRHVVKTTLFDTSDGVRSVGVYGSYGPHVTKSPDGRIWFLPRDGVSIIDPRHLLFNKEPPPVHIEQVIADDKSYDAVQGMRLPAHSRDVTIDYTALSLMIPEKVRFRVKLEGQDADWRELVNERRVNYTNLAPRHYRFRVMAANNSGVWNETGAFLDFSVAPAWYQTAWFRIVCIAAFLALLWGAYWLRVHQLRQQFNAGLEARVGERIRIARELHDTLLQSFQGVMLQLYAFRSKVTPAEARERFDALLEQGQQAVTEGRDAVKEMRSSTVVKNDLARALDMLGEGLAAEQNADRPIEFRVAVEGETRNLHPIVRDEVYHIAGEATRNAFRHSGAKRIEIEIYYEERQLRVRILDNGRGIDPKVLNGGGREGHYGLPGMNERAKLAGGKLAVWSKLDAGTRVELTIPATRAYIRSSARQSIS